MAQKALTIEMSNDLIKLCEVSHDSKGVTVHKAVTVPTPEGAVEDGFLKDVGAVSAAIKSAMSSDALTCKDVIFTVLSTKIATKEAVLPNVKSKKLDELIRANAAEYFPVNNIEDYSLTHSVLETITEGKEKNLRVLAIAAPFNMIKPYYDLAKLCGLNVVAVDYLGNSTLQMLKLQIDDAPSMVIQIGNDSTIINVMKNKILQFQRTVPYGKSAVVGAIMDVKKVSNAVAMELISRASIIHETFDGEEITDSLKYLVNSINRIVEYYISRNQSNPIEKAYLMGEGASIIGIEKLFSNELNIDFNKIVELNGVEPDKFFRINKTDLLTYLAPMGACLAPVNFKLVASTSKAKEARNVDITKYLVMAIIVSAVVSVVLIAIPLVKYTTLKSKTKKYEDDIKKLDGAKKTYDEYLLYDASAKAAKDFFDNDCSNNNDYLYLFLKDLETNLPSDVSLISILSDNGSVTLSGYCKDKPTLARILMQLKDMDYVNNVVTKGGTESQSADGLTTVTFTVTCNFITPVPSSSKYLDEKNTDKKEEK